MHAPAILRMCTNFVDFFSRGCGQNVSGRGLTILIHWDQFCAADTEKKIPLRLKVSINDTVGIAVTVRPFCLWLNNNIISPTAFNKGLMLQKLKGVHIYSNVTLSFCPKY